MRLPGPGDPGPCPEPDPVVAADRVGNRGCRLVRVLGNLDRKLPEHRYDVWIDTFENSSPSCPVDIRRSRTSTRSGSKQNYFSDFFHLSLIHISEPTRRTPISYAV